MLRTGRCYARRIDRLSVEGAFNVLAKAKKLEAKGKDIIHLEIGEPDFDTPENIRQAAIKAMEAGHTHYAPSLGIWELRETVASHISATRNIPVRPEEVVIAPGVKPVILFAILACVEQGDEVIYPNPAYPTYESLINFVEAKPVAIPLEEEQDFNFQIDILKKMITPRTKMIILNSPHNPTGGMLPPFALEEIAKIAIEKDLIVLSDEIYSRIIYEGEFLSIASLPGMKERTILADGFSKTYAMTGWRLGYGVMPEKLISIMSKLMNNSNACTCTFVQWAGIEALTGSQEPIQEMIEEFRRRREIIVNGLNKIKGFHCQYPKGAFYVFPNIRDTGLNSRELADRLLEEAGVAVLSGTCFGKYGEGYLRLSYANSIPNIEEALKRIDNFMKGLTFK